MDGQKAKFDLPRLGDERKYFTLRYGNQLTTAVLIILIVFSKYFREKKSYGQSSMLKIKKRKKRKKKLKE